MMLSCSIGAVVLFFSSVDYKGGHDDFVIVCPMGQTMSSRNVLNDDDTTMLCLN